MKKRAILQKKDGYNWTYRNIGGVARVDICSGEDIAHLDELDRKLWTVLSCPIKKLEFDQKTLQLLDSDSDGKIFVDEVIAAAKWITSLIKDRDLLLKGEDSLPLDQINTGNPEGAALHSSAKQILANLGLEKDSISLADLADGIAIFKNTKFNGDGIITPASADDEKLKKVIEETIAAFGSVTDRSGAEGIDEAKIEAFYAACAAYAEWQDSLEKGKDEILPFGDNTADALAACEAVKEKIADFFMRCKLIAFNEECSGKVDVSAERIGAISDKNLAACEDEIASYPIAHPGKDQLLHFDGINPAWKAAFDRLKVLVLDVLYPGKDSLSEAEWNAALAKFGAFSAWTAGKKGAEVEKLGLARVCEILKEDGKAALLELVAQDKALEAEATSIDKVDKLMHYYRYLYEFLRNYVIMGDFYDTGKKAVFEAGRLFIDQRCCELCIEVEDMGKHADMAGLSGMFLIYCACTSKTRNATMNILAVMTDGGVASLRPGKNAVFYDRKGEGWDAVVTKIVDNPISIRQAFWSPYRKAWNFFVDKINKSAADKDNAATALLKDKVEAGPSADAKAPKPAFDIAKFAGIFAAIGMAVGFIGDFLTKIAVGVATHPLNALFALLAIMICISGPSCFIAWSKLRKRNLAPVLNANGWAINSTMLISIVFGATLTSTAKYPKVEFIDPHAMKLKKKENRRRSLVITAVVIIALGTLYLTNCFSFIGLKSPFAKEKPCVEQVTPAVECTPAQPAETPAQ